VFAREHAGLLLLHLVLVLLLGRRPGASAAHPARGGWSGMLRHPWAVAVFATTAVLARRYILAPPLWDVVTWSLLTGSGAVLASGRCCVDGRCG
jgi:hypothetical protein